ARTIGGGHRTVTWTASGRAGAVRAVPGTVPARGASDWRRPGPGATVARVRFPNDRSVAVSGRSAVTLDGEALEQLRKRVRSGGAEKYHAANAAKGKLFARERVARLVDE